MWSIDTAFPGANLIVDSLTDDTACVRQDWSTSREWWFHWAFRVRGAADRTLRFTFTDGDVFHGGGPCVRIGDSPRGQGWKALGRGVVVNNGFSYHFAPGEDEVFFAFAPLHTGADWEAFVSTQSEFVRHRLTESEGRREVAYFTHGPATDSSPIVLLTARSHACESLASYLMEGIVAGWIHGADPAVAAARNHTSLWVLPYLDIDGVERGEQGKFRSPRDHNQDFQSDAMYRSTRALMELAQVYRERLVLCLDLHCPWIRGGRNESLFLAAPPPEQETAFRNFSALLAGRVKGPIPYDPSDDVPFGSEWNQYRSCHGSRFMAENTDACLAITVEFPYGLARGVPVTPESARTCGTQFACAMADFINSIASSPSARKNFPGKQDRNDALTKHGSLSF